jgi:hypothetical protein
MGPSKRAVPCVFALLPDKEGKTYQHLWKIIKSLVEFEEGLPVTVMSNFEKAVLNTMEKAFPTTNVVGAISTTSRQYGATFRPRVSRFCSTTVQSLCTL